MMDEKLYHEYIAGFVILQAAVANKEKMVFVVHKAVAPDDVNAETPDRLPTRVISYAPSVFKETGGYARLEWAHGITHLYPALAPRSVLVDDLFSVWESKTDDEFHEICPGKGDAQFSSPFTRRCWGVRQIGDDVFAFGRQRKVFHRRGYNDWIDLTDDKEHAYLYQDILEWRKKGKSYQLAKGFRGLDGFSVDDIYAGGSTGDLWRYDGKEWQRVDIPTNFKINAISCGGDGLVYVSGGGKHILKGREDRWEFIDAARSGNYSYAVEINASAWFEDKLYVATDMGLFVVEDDKLIEYQFPDDGPQQYSFKRVVASQDCLVSYGLDQALVFDGRTWSTIIDNPIFQENS